MGAVKDITGQRFGKLVAIDRCGTGKNRQAMWRLQCDCGNLTERPSSSLHAGRARSCGCLREGSGRKPMPRAEVETRLTGMNIELVSYGGKARAPSTFQCTVDGCGHVWTTSSHHVVGTDATGCPQCAGLVKLEEYEAHQRLEGRSIRLLEYGGGILKPSTFACTVVGCGYVWSTTLSSVTGTTMNGCSRCSGREKVTRSAAVDRLLGKPIELLTYGGTTNSTSKFRCLNRGCGHEWETPYCNVDSRDTGCPACAESGFNPMKDADIYAYKITSDHKQYIGFGITGSPKRRASSHQHSFNKAGATGELLFSYKTTGAIAQEYETIVKKNFPIVDTGVQGFRTEAFEYDDELLYLIKIGAEHAHRKYLETMT